ncbi:MBL fold metallo-hydrolase [Legionella brunensis]|uniref:Metallo-beta-lactamase superfamily protein n=1 Tax=Legionella brunensis TaxID=29422 RepID=A0A0W0ST12_9GAMM|nr:MBL fold metallo-hydrolase [Legionella brunensis]KTC86554.1 metallo-beta-lactamase superfamily protein [Legionella brunensis]
MKLTFLGATGTVTGSKYLLEVENKKILVDCGLFQGFKELRLRNWEPLPIKPSSIDAVVITHAHIDHTGYLPLLVKNGFKGPIYSSKATKELCAILLPDSGYLQEEDAKRANKYGYTKHHPALPLYTQDDAVEAIKQFKIVEYGIPYILAKSCQFSWHQGGHIPGASLIHINYNGLKILFSGDLGRAHDPIMKSPTIMTDTNYLILESTYGNRLHDKTNPEEEIARIVNDTVRHGGTILIPAFAVGRAQNILYYLYHLKQSNRIPDLPIYLDSPMAIDATEILNNNKNEHHLTSAQCYNVCHAATYINTPEESKAISNSLMPKVIISASGMMTGGRILHHLKIIAPNPRNTILITGFQASGTRGEQLLHHAQTIKIHGQLYPVRAKVCVLDNISAHADYEEILLWLKNFNSPPRQVFLTHGEPAASTALKEHIESELSWSCIIPTYLDTVLLI